MLQRIFDKYLFEAARTGIEERIRIEYFKPRELTCEVSFTPIGFSMVIMLFKLLASGLALGTVIFILENFLNICKSKCC